MKGHEELMIEEKEEEGEKEVDEAVADLNLQDAGE